MTRLHPSALAALFFAACANVVLSQSEFIVDQPEIDCKADSMELSVEFSEPFSGKVYPKGLSKTENCTLEGDGSTRMRFSLALFGCATVAEEQEGGSVNYNNVIVFQRHGMLVTGNDVAYKVHCLYSLGEKTVSNEVNVDMIPTTAVIQSTPELPLCWLHIKRGDSPDGQTVSGAVSLGTVLTFVIEMDDSEVYGFTVSHCIARDGIGWGETMLIDADGCPTNPDIFPTLTYDQPNQRIYTPFRAHKFPTSMQVYYQCNVKLCFKSKCEVPDCSGGAGGLRRKRRQAPFEEIIEAGDEDGEDTVVVVRDVIEVADVDALRDEETPAGPPSHGQRQEEIEVRQRTGVTRVNRFGVTQVETEDGDAICLNTVGFALGIAIFAGIFLLSIVIAALLCLRTRSRKSVPEYDISAYENTGYAEPTPDYR